MREIRSAWASSWLQRAVLPDAKFFETDTPAASLLATAAHEGMTAGNLCLYCPEFLRFSSRVEGLFEFQ